MKITVTEHIFREAFRQQRPTHFSYEALGELFHYLDQYDQEPDIELDVIGICCDFVEYQDISEFQENYGSHYKTLTDIEHQTIVIEVGNGSFIAANI
jgi:hypothetical protein